MCELIRAANSKNFEDLEVMFEFYRWAKEKGCQFVLGFDFHRIEQYITENLADKRTQTPLDENSRKKLQEISQGDLFYTNSEELRLFEESVRGQLTEVFIEGRGAFGLPKNLTKIFRPI